MEKKRDDQQLNAKLDEIRDRLLATPSEKELTGMQLQLEVIEQWVRVTNLADADHQHDHMADHDNTAFVEPVVVLASKEITAARDTK
ncbi:MAG TPA: hypothetical protein VFE32_03665 [Puia sp.]|jgi:outer membrane biogenesis lipoprotein LolB|nr:hypothetical protein [Puia sp.]